MEIEVITLLPPVTGNELQATKLPPAVKPTESSAVPSSIMYVSKGILLNIEASAVFLAIGLACGSFGAGTRNALAGASAGIRAEFAFNTVRDMFFAAGFRCASANGIAQTATSRSR